MLSATSQIVDRIPTKAAPTCAECYSFLNGVCLTKAAADWGDRAKVSPTRPACPFVERLPF